jgi:hypothetical protein
MLIGTVEHPHQAVLEKLFQSQREAGCVQSLEYGQTLPGTIHLDDDYPEAIPDELDQANQSGILTQAALAGGDFEIILDLIVDQVQDIVDSTPYDGRLATRGAFGGRHGGMTIG